MSELQFEPMNYLTCTAMSAQGARDFFGGPFFKVVYAGQALGTRMRFGARTYLLFRTEAAWKKHQAEQSAA